MMSVSSILSSAKSNLSALRTYKFWYEFVVMTLGMLVAGAAVYYFLIPSKLIIGTISGLSIVLSQIFGNIGVQVSVSTLITFINVILLVLAYFLVDHNFGLKTVYTALILGPMTDLCDAVLPWQSIAQLDALGNPISVMGDPWFDLVCFVLVLSASQAILFRINASTGGLDILAKIVNKYLHFDIGASVSVAGAVICCTAFAIHPFRMVVIGLIGTWINGLVVDYFTASLNKRKRVCIITDQTETVRQFIVNDLVRGCSLYELTGGYSGEKKTEIEVLLTQDEFSNLMAFIKDNQIHAFITAGNVSEVYGLWFAHSSQKDIKKHRLDL